VAIKILPALFATDPERVARFQREAHVLATLNHPHIAQIYGLEEVGDVRALVMELVDDGTLAERVGRGPIPVEDALPIARQIAEALEAAHEKGIIHRDLKPSNIGFTRSGQVKVLDFGLAKSAGLEGAASHSALSVSPTITSPALVTSVGGLLGTAVYMAPEQAKGRTADKRADVWAFGCVLFEMLTGGRAFHGENVTETLAAVLMKEPDWHALPPAVPRHVERLLHRCLRKDPRQRLQDIGDARLELDEPADEPEASPPVAPRRARRAAQAAAIAVAVLIGIVAGRFALAPSLPSVRPVRFEISSPRLSSAVLSPDGSRMVIAAQGKLWVRDLARVDLRALDGTDGAVRPFWSRDGATIGYGAKGKLWTVAASGGSPVAICDLVGGLWDEDAGGAWLADDTIVYSDGNTALFRVSSKGGDPVAVLKPDPKRDELHFHTVGALPDGRSVMYVIHRGGTAQTSDTIGLWSDGTARTLLQMPGQTLEDPVYSPSGHILFERTPNNGGVWAVPFSPSSQQVTGAAFLVASGMRRPSVSADRTLVVLPPRPRRPLNLAWVGRDGAIVSRIEEPRLRNADAALSPDGQRLAVSEVDEGKSDIWIYDLARQTRSRLTRDGVAAAPVWLPDGRDLLYGVRTVVSVRPGDQIKRVAADASDRSDTIGEGFLPVPTREGGVLYLQRDKDGEHLWYRSLTTRDSKPTLFMDQAFYSITPAPSPDGHFVAYAAATGPGQSEVYLRRFPKSESVWQVSSNGGMSPRWSSDGRLFFARGPEIFEVAITTSPDIRVGAPVRLFTRAASDAAVPPGFNVTPDGRRFLIYEPVGASTEERISVVLNWSADLAR
jgi:Tol biopolymer transport system component